MILIQNKKRLTYIPEFKKVGKDREKTRWRHRKKEDKPRERSQKKSTLPATWSWTSCLQNCGPHPIKWKLKEKKTEVAPGRKNSASIQMPSGSSYNINSPWASSLTACPINFGFASLHCCISTSRREVWVGEQQGWEPSSWTTHQRLLLPAKSHGNLSCLPHSWGQARTLSPTMGSTSRRQSLAFRSKPAQVAGPEWLFWS